MNPLLSADRTALLFLNSWTGHSVVLDTIFTAIGEWAVYLVPFLLIGVWVWITYGKEIKHRAQQKLTILQAVIAGLFSWVVLNSIIGHFYFRARPFAGVGGVKEVLIHRPDKSFPSDHASFLFSIGFYFILAGWKRTGWTVIIAGVLVSLGRVILGVHYPLDIVGGLAIGFVGAWIIYALRSYVEAYISKPIIKLASWIGL